MSKHELTGLLSDDLVGGHVCQTNARIGFRGVPLILHQVDKGLNALVVHDVSAVVGVFVRQI